MNQRNEIIIIGGGVIGACIAYYLSGEKHDVTIVEKNQIQPAKGYSISVRRTTSSSSIPLSLVDQKVAVTPMGDQLRMSSNLELVGYDSTINRRRIAAIRRAVNMYLSGIDELELIQIWSGFRPNTPDTLPIIERNETFNNLILATGHDTLGMTHSLVTGKLVSEIIDGDAPSVDLMPLRLSRFQ